MLLPPILAQMPPGPMPGGEPPASWIPVVLLIVIGVVFAAGTLVASALVGPRRTGPGKAIVYESGVMPVGDTRRRFNVRYYIVAMIFLVFDVEIVFFYPWASIFPRYAADPALRGAGGVLLIDMIVFVVLLLVAYIYAWGKGVFRWE